MYRTTTTITWSLTREVPIVYQSNEHHSRLVRVDYPTGNWTNNSSSNIHSTKGGHQNMSSDRVYYNIQNTVYHTKQQEYFKLTVRCVKHFRCYKRRGMHPALWFLHLKWSVCLKTSLIWCYCVRSCIVINRDATVRIEEAILLKSYQNLQTFFVYIWTH